MSKSPIIDRLERIDAQKKRVTGISASIKSMIDYKILDEAVLEMLYKERYPNEKLRLKDIGISDRNNNINYLIATYLILGFTFTSALSIITGSFVIPAFVMTGLAFVSISLRKKWLRERIELMAERKGYKSSAFKIASSVKYLDIMHVDYNEKEVKRALYKILRTSKTLHVHEVLRLQVNLYEAYIENEELGLLEEEAFDHHYVPESFKPEMIEEDSTIDMLMMDDEYESMSENAELAQKRFEEAFGGKDDEHYIEQIAKAELHQSMSEVGNAMENISRQSPLNDSNSENPSEPSVDVDDLMSEIENSNEDDNQSLAEILSSAPETSIMDDVSEIQDTALRKSTAKEEVRKEPLKESLEDANDLDALPFESEPEAPEIKQSSSEQPVISDNFSFDEDYEDDDDDDDIFSGVGGMPEFTPVEVEQEEESEIDDDNLDDLLHAINDSENNK